MKSQISTSPTIEEFARLVGVGINAWVEAGKILNALVEQDESVRQRISDKIPWMTTFVLSGFERMGREEIFPQLLLDRSPGAHALIALPYGEQKRLHSASIALVVYKKGEIVTEHRRLQDLTEREAGLVFTETSVRSVAEQSKIVLAKVRGSGTRVAPRDPEPVPRDEESEVPETLEDDPRDTAEQHLSRAQAELIRAREIIGQSKAPERLDSFITIALTAIGKLRYELKEGQE